jgi:regulator of protease activity HflC (stomatin/prohibitin superfamily)
VLVRTVRIVPQQTALIIERLGRYSRTLEGGIHILVPFVDKVRANIDLREQVVSFPPQPVITSDNLVVNIDTVIYYSVIDAKSAVYEIANFIQGIEQLTVTTLRNVIGSLDLEQTLTSRDQINGQLRGVLDEATGKWGIRVNRVELKAIDPPMSVQESMEKQMKAERDRRAAILNAEGTKASQILTAEGEKQSQILRAEGSAQARILEAQGQARAIQQVFDAIHRGKPTREAAAPTSTSRSCRSSPAATATRCGSSPANSPTPSRASTPSGGMLGRSARSPRTSRTTSAWYRAA